MPNSIAPPPGYLKGAVVDRANRWAAQQTFAAEIFENIPAAMTTIDWDVNKNQVRFVSLNVNTTLRWPIGLRLGGVYILFVKNVSTYTLSYGNQSAQSGQGAGTWKWVGGTTPTLTATAGKIDIITCAYDGTDLISAIQQNA